MGVVPQKILNWLYSVLTDYRDVNRAYSDIAQTISQFSNFSLRTDVYTYEDGRSSLLVNIAGTLPVNFRGTTYMFPISIWVPQEYPRAAPMTLITPTANMLIRPGQYISGEGRIYHPYLAGWREDRSNIVSLLLILQQVFAREPPVISREEQIPQDQIISRPMLSPKPDQEPPPIPPLPPELGSSDTGSGPLRATSVSDGRPPQPPPKPFASTEWPRTQPNSGPPQLPPQLPLHPSRVDTKYRPPPEQYAQVNQRVMPPMPLNLTQNPNHFEREYMPTTPKHPKVRPYNPGSRQESYSPVSPLTPERKLEKGHPNESTRIIWTCCHCKIQYPSQTSPEYCQNCEHPRCNNCQVQFGQPKYYQGPISPEPPTILSRPNPPEYQWSRNQLQNLQQNPPQTYSDPRYHPPEIAQISKPKSKPKPTEDLLTSPFETPLPVPTANIAPPPIPPNPQKDAILSALSQSLTQQIHSTYNSTMAAIPPLRAQQSALQSTLVAINNEISQLNDLQSLLSSNEAILHKAMRDADQVMEDAKHRKVPGVDEVLVAPTVVAGQLYALVADERSIEDCRGFLGRALDRGRIGGDVWAKQTRSLAREEFLKKAFIKKIAKGMGLVEEERWG